MNTPTIILPGYSIKNKDWAESIAKELESTTVHNWEHWTNVEKDPDWISKEVHKIKDEIGDKQVNLLTKSLGTGIAMYLLRDNHTICRKLILCGVPLNDLNDSDKEAFHVLTEIPAESVLVIQNESDSHGTFPEVEMFIHSINPLIEVISKPGDTHEYPYPEDFKEFLA